MTVSLAGKKILLGVTGSIAAYKTADWVRALRKEESHVSVIMTESGARFVTPLTMAALSGNRVFGDMFDHESAGPIPHITLAKECDLILVAPTTAHTIARLAHGLADDLLSTVVLATDKKVLVCPAMNSTMYNHPATQANLGRIKEFGYEIVEPAVGLMACGDEGPGRLPDWDTVREAIFKTLSTQDLSGCSVLITAGPTREPLDPARFLSNRSTGKMGYAIARTAKRRGGAVTLVSGPTSLPAPPGVKFIRVNTAHEMYQEVLNRQGRHDIVVKAAAVADFRPKTAEPLKQKKRDSALHLELEHNPDILYELGKRKKRSKSSPFLIGFAAESHDHLKEGQKKLQGKNLDLMIVNDILGDDTGFAANSNRVTMLDRTGGIIEVPMLPKEEVADRIWDHALKLFAEE